MGLVSMTNTRPSGMDRSDTVRPIAVTVVGFAMTAMGASTGAMGALNALSR